MRQSKVRCAGTDQLMRGGQIRYFTADFDQKFFAKRFTNSLNGFDFRVANIDKFYARLSR